MNIKLSQAIDGCTLARQVSGCCNKTIRNHRKLDVEGQRDPRTMMQALRGSRSTYNRGSEEGGR